MDAENVQKKCASRIFPHSNVTMELIIFTDFVNRLEFEAKKKGIRILETFHYSFGSFLRIETDQDQAKVFLEDFDFLIDYHKENKKAP